LKLSETLSLSASNVRRHRLRSALTSTGIAVGIAVVIALMTLGSSFQAYFVGQYNVTFAANAFSIQPQAIDTAAALSGSGSAIYIFPAAVFSQNDASAVGEISGVKSVAPYAQTGQPSSLTVGGTPIQTTYRVPVMEMSTVVFDEGFLKLANGTAAKSGSEAEVGYAVAQAIAIEVGATNDTNYALGKQIGLNMGGHLRNVTVVGILAEAPVDTSLNTRIYLPTSPDVANVTAPIYSGLLVFTKPGSDYATVEQGVVGYLNSGSDALTRLRATGQGLRFSAASVSAASSFLQQQVNEYSTIILAMGVVALLGGAVGMSNIMLVSVAERTREIGTIKAIGGSRRDILLVFLMESLILSLIGMALGTVGGAALGYWLTTFRLLGLQLPLVYNVAWFFIAAGIGLATGLIAGVYPAWTASRMQPVQALRNE
jgi:putative ABC transport system permease protein